MTLVLTNALLADGAVVDVTIDGALISAITPTGSAVLTEGAVVRDLTGYVVVPAAAEPHAHLDKAFLADRVPNPRGDLMTAIEGMQRWHHTMTHADIVERAERAVRTMVANGITSIRTHADTMEGHGLASVLALAEVRERVAEVCDLEIVVLIGWPLTGVAGAGNRALLVDALAAGGSVVGGCPHLDDDPAGAVEVALTIAADHHVPVDLHTDETLNPMMLSLRTLAERVLATGFEGPVAASHCVSLGMVDEATQRSVAEVVARAGVSVITLPQTNLFLQARGMTTAPPRGLTAVRVLMDAGVNVAAGADNLQDPFNTVGRADPMETASLMVMAGHLSPEEALQSVTGAARRAIAAPGGTLAVGQPAELVAMRAATIREAVAFGPADRMVLHRGRIVSDRRLVDLP